MSLVKNNSIDYEIYTDGACSGNPGPGGWAYYIKDLHTGKTKQNSGSIADTTNNQMEMLAALNALSSIESSSNIDLFTDSKYLQQGMTSWIFGWQKKNWKTASGSAVKNKEIWQKLLYYAKKHVVNWHWVKGHANHPENELVDSLARAAVDTLG